MENSFPYYFSTALIISYLIFGIIGAITIKILLTWANRTVRVLDLVRGAASWILGPLIVLFIHNVPCGRGFLPSVCFLRISNRFRDCDRYACLPDKGKPHAKLALCFN